MCPLQPHCGYAQGSRPSRRTLRGILSPLHLENGSRLGPYEIVAAIGAGGIGEFYRARDTRLGRDVAIPPTPEPGRRLTGGSREVGSPDTPQAKESLCSSEGVFPRM